MKLLLWHYKPHRYLTLHSKSATHSIGSQLVRVFSKYDYFKAQVRLASLCLLGQAEWRVESRVVRLHDLAAHNDCAYITYGVRTKPLTSYAD